MRVVTGDDVAVEEVDDGAAEEEDAEAAACLSSSPGTEAFLFLPSIATENHVRPSKGPWVSSVQA